MRRRAARLRAIQLVGDLQDTAVALGQEQDPARQAARYQAVERARRPLLRALLTKEDRPMSELHRWITLAQAASRTGLDGKTVGKRVRRGDFGRTRLTLLKGRWRRELTVAGLTRFLERRRAARARSSR